jgi:hypothetical protein
MFPCTQVLSTFPSTFVFPFNTTVLPLFLMFSSMRELDAFPESYELTKAPMLVPFESKSVKDPVVPLASMPVLQLVKVQLVKTKLKPPVLTPVVHRLKLMPFKAHCWPDKLMPTTPPLKVRSFYR